MCHRIGGHSFGRQACPAAAGPRGGESFISVYGAFSSFIFAYQGQSIFYEFMREMRDRCTFPKAAAVAYVMMALVYSVTSLTAYSLQGNALASFLPDSMEDSGIAEVWTCARCGTANYPQRRECRGCAAAIGSAKEELRGNAHSSCGQRTQEQHTQKYGHQKHEGRGANAASMPAKSEVRQYEGAASLAGTRVQMQQELAKLERWYWHRYKRSEKRLERHARKEEQLKRLAEEAAYELDEAIRKLDEHRAKKARITEKVERTRSEHMSCRKKIAVDKIADEDDGGWRIKANASDSDSSQQETETVF